MKRINKIGLILLGNLLYAVAVAYFILPSGLITGGTTGLALFARYLWGVPVTVFVLIFNVVMFLIGAAVLGRMFALSTLISTISYPVMLSLMQALEIKTGELTDDIMLSTIFAGALIGVGIGLVIRAGASTGGMDIPPLVIQKKTGLSVSILLYAFDVIILILQMLFSDQEKILYGILLVCIYTIVLEKLLVAGKRQIQLKIVSEQYESINKAIVSQMDRGTTLLQIEGGYTRKPSMAVLTVVSQRELFKVNELVLGIDSDAFLIISQVNEVRGRGFTSGKEYRQLK